MKSIRVIAATLVAAVVSSLIVLVGGAMPAQAAASQETAIKVQGLTRKITIGQRGYIAVAVRDAGGSVYEGTVTLQKMPAGTRSWTTAQRQEASGYVSFTVTPRKNTRYRVVYSGGSAYGETWRSSSRDLGTMAVARKITGKYAVTGKRLTGRVTPNAARHVVKLQVSGKRNGAYRTIKSFRTNWKGNFANTYPNKRGKFYRLMVPASRGYARSVTAGF